MARSSSADASATAAAAPASAKTERLLNLVIALLNSRQYRTASWIRRNVAGYGDAPSDDAFFRMFERDKNELRELQVPLDTDGEDGYRIPPTEFSLPELTFTPAEFAAVAETYHAAVMDAHQSHGKVAVPLPKLNGQHEVGEMTDIPEGIVVDAEPKRAKNGSTKSTKKSGAKGNGTKKNGASSKKSAAKKRNGDT